MITNKDYLGAAAGILAVEAYHASEVRTVLYGMSQQNGDPNGIVKTMAQAISALRAELGGRQGPGHRGQPTGDANIVPTNASSIAFARTTGKVLNIVYGGKGLKGTGGLFFPNGMNGAKSAGLNGSRARLSKPGSLPVVATALCRRVRL